MLIVKDCMKQNVISILDTDSIGTAGRLFVEHHIGTLPVVNSRGQLVGILQLRDLLALVLPDFIRLVEDFDFVHDFGAVETRHPTAESLIHPVSEVMRSPVAVEESCGLIRAASVMNQQNLLDLPVIDVEMRLVGIASRVDIGVSLIASWENLNKREGA